MPKSAFNQITVLDFSRYLPGGYATQTLADLGANVISARTPVWATSCATTSPPRATACPTT